MDLINIGKKHPTSKNVSGFIELYQKYFADFKDKKINILEIGIDKKDFSISGTEILIGDQSDHNFLKSVIDKYNNFDIIIDDGSHQSKHIITSFKYLFPYLNNNGLYVVEDLQTSYIPRYGGSRINLKKNNSSMNFIKSLSDSINYEKNDRPFFKKNTFDGKIKSIYFYQNIAFVNKGESVNYFYNNDNKLSFINKIKKIISIFF